MKKLSILIVFCSIACTNLVAQSVFTGSGFWHTSSNWNLSSVPAITEHVVISGSCVVGSNVTCSSLFISYLGSITIDTAKELTINGPIFLPIGNNLIINGKLVLLGDIYSGQIKRIQVNGGLECFSLVEFP